MFSVEFNKYLNRRIYNYRKLKESVHTELYHNDLQSKLADIFFDATYINLDIRIKTAFRAMYEYLDNINNNDNGN